MVSQTITVPGLAQPFIQNYTYDELNRLKTATETNNGAQTWTQVFGYDRYGNRNFTSGTGQTSLTFGSTNNRITTSGYSYDLAGNTTNDPSGKSFTYDAENKQKTAVVNGYTNEYHYDGDGRRVKKVVPSTGETTVFVYDAMGRTVAEYSTIVEPPATAKVAYLTSDHLGSPRINTDANGNVISRHDYHPFGEEIATPQRSSGLGYSADTVRKQFTGYERDDESGLDFAEARMFAASFGRFTSVDPIALEQRHLIEPQALNRYVYVTNNPYAYIDSSGLEKVKFIVRTFIPQPTASVPGVKLVGSRPPRPLPTIRTLEGDNRNAGEAGTYRTEQVIEVETDASRNNGNPYYAGDNNVGPSRELDADRRVIREATADKKGLTSAVSRDGATINIELTGEATVPLVTGAPAISYDFKIGVQSGGPAGNLNVSIKGSHDGFPGYEVFVVRPETGNSEAKLLYSHDPRSTSQTPVSLFPPKEFKVDKNIICNSERICKPN